MSSELMDNLGIGWIDPAYFLLGLLVFIVVLLVLVIVALCKASSLKKRLDKFTQGRNGKSMEKEIAALFEDNTFLKQATEKNKKDIRSLFHNMEFAYQKCGIIKYDAFNQMGGKLSFCLALLNERNDGVILNSVHGSDGCYFYSKEIEAGKCNITLGEEESEALKMAIGEED